MRVETFRTGGDRNLGYLAVDEASKEAFVVDPSYDPQSIADAASRAGINLRYAFCTHAHLDHTNGNEAFENATGVRPLLFGDTEPVTRVRVAHGALLPLGQTVIRILHTPGHSPDSICLLAGDAVFTGDTLFVGKVGGTAASPDARAEYESLHSKLLALPDATRIYPGHDVGVAPSSTIGEERRTNPFLLQPDFEAFVHLKRTWAQYKKEHGIA